MFCLQSFWKNICLLGISHACHRDSKLSWDIGLSLWSAWHPETKIVLIHSSYWESWPCCSWRIRSPWRLWARAFPGCRQCCQWQRGSSPGWGHLWISFRAKSTGIWWRRSRWVGDDSKPISMNFIAKKLAYMRPEVLYLQLGILGIGIRGGSWRIDKGFKSKGTGRTRRCTRKGRGWLTGTLKTCRQQRKWGCNVPAGWSYLSSSPSTPYSG